MPSKSIRSQCLHVISFASACRSPVSYTHLDVYKRQVLFSKLKVNANKGVKYKRIISQLFPPKRTGHGHNNNNIDTSYMTLTRKKDKIDYVH